MLAEHPVIAFLATSDSERARAFYQDVLGLRVLADEEWALVLEAHGTMVRIQKTREVVVAPYTALGWQVPDLRATMAALRERGVTFERYGFLPQDEDGVWTTPDGAAIAWLKDPDGHTLSLTQF